MPEAVYVLHAPVAKATATAPSPSITLTAGTVATGAAVAGHDPLYEILTVAGIIDLLERAAQDPGYVVLIAAIVVALRAVRRPEAQRQ